MSEMVLANAHVVGRDEVFTRTVLVERGTIAAVDRGAFAALEAADFEGALAGPGGARFA